jgi:hypothetical protein
MWAADIAKATDGGKTHVSSVMSTIKKKAKVLTRRNLKNNPLHLLKTSEDTL